MNDKRFETWWAITTAPDGEIWIKNRLYDAKVLCLNLGGGVVQFVHRNTAEAAHQAYVAAKRNLHTGCTL